MSDPAFDIVKYLSAKEDGWWVELKMASESSSSQSTIFVHSMPDAPDFAVAAMRYEGRGADETFSNPLHTRHPRVQVMVRHPSSKASLERADEIFVYLNAVKDQVINGTKYQRIKGQGEASELGPDPQGRQRAVINFEVSYYG